MAAAETTPRATDLSWSRFLSAVQQLVPDLAEDLKPHDTIAEVARDDFHRAVLFSALVQLGRGLPEDLVWTISDLHEAHEWCRTKWQDSEFPARLTPAVARELRTGSRVRLRPVLPDDMPMLYKASMSPEFGFRWRLRGASTSVDDFERMLYGGTLVHFIAERCDTGTPQGIVAAYDARFSAQSCYLAFQRTTDEPGVSEMFEAFILFVDYVFRTWNFRKIYADVPGFNFAKYCSHPSDLFEIEARLRGHDFYNGQWWDLFTIAIYRERFAEFSQLWGPLLGFEPLRADATTESAP